VSCRRDGPPGPRKEQGAGHRPTLRTNARHLKVEWASVHVYAFTIPVYRENRPVGDRLHDSLIPSLSCGYGVVYREVVELRQLASFLAVVEEGQFARAAARLFLSPPAVTGHINRLERELGVRLLQRSPVAPTPAGERLVPHARAMLAAANAASDAVSDLRSGGDAPLRVGVMAPGSAELTPAILRAFHHAQPDTPLNVESLKFTEHVSALVEHRVDVAFVRPPPLDERISVDVLTTEPRVLIVPSAGSLAGVDAIRLADVLDLEYVSVPEGTPRLFTDYLYFAQARNGTAPRRVPDETTTVQDVLTSVAAGRGTGAALYSVSRIYRWPGIRFVPIVDAPWEHTALASRRGDRRPEILAFRALASALARDVGPALVPSPKLPELRPGEAARPAPGTPCLDG
jgi:DNA-binding transcriptional LysR family regulator